MKFGGNQELWGDGEIYLSYSEVCFQKHEELEFEEKKKEEEKKNPLRILNLSVTKNKLRQILRFFFFFFLQ